MPRKRSFAKTLEREIKKVLSPPRKRKRNPGWPKGHSAKHRKASKLGWSRKRRLLAYQKKKRGTHAVKVDRTKQAQRVYSSRDKAGVKKWKKAPHKYDIKGVDTVRFRLVQRSLKPIYVKGKQRVKKRLAQGKARERAIKKSKLPRKVKRQRIKQTRVKTKRDVKAIVRTTKTEAKVKAKKIRTVPPPGRRWGSQRKKEARYVARVTKANTVQADALVQRAKSKGYAYDNVDWDRLQGKDLSYRERVRKLDRQVGKTLTQNEEDRFIRSEMERFEDQYERFTRKEARRQGYGKTV